MPSMDGYEFLRRLREMTQTASTKVILYSGTFSGLDEESLAKSGGVMALLKKPISSSEMKKVVEAAIKAPEHAPKNIDPGFAQEHLRILTNQLTTKVLQLEKTNAELNHEIEMRIQAEKQATQSKIFFQSLANSIPQLAWQALANGQIIYTNQRWQHFHQLFDSSITLQQWAISFHPDDRVRVVDQFTTSFAQGQDFQCEVRLFEKQTQKHSPYWISAIAVHGHEPNSISWFGTCTDISIQKNYELELTRLKENAERLSKAKTEFLNNISHEIRTPMNAILGFSDILKDLTETDSQANLMAQKINTHATRLMKILSDTISISEVEAHGHNSSAEEFNIQVWLNDFDDYAKRQAAQKGLRFNLVQNLDQMLTCRSYPKAARSVLENLFENAVKFTSTGQIDLRTYIRDIPPDSNQKYIFFEIEDTGIGIDPNKTTLLFQSFSQSDASITRQYGGLGLGLLLSKKLANSVGGQLKLLHSKPGQGSCFIFTCPLLTENNRAPDYGALL